MVATAPPKLSDRRPAQKFCENFHHFFQKKIDIFFSQKFTPIFTPGSGAPLTWGAGPNCVRSLKWKFRGPRASRGWGEAFARAMPKPQEGAKILPGLWQNSVRKVPKFCQDCGRILPEKCQNTARKVAELCQKCGRNLPNMRQNPTKRRYRAQPGRWQDCAREVPGSGQVGARILRKLCQNSEKRSDKILPEPWRPAVVAKNLK